MGLLDWLNSAKQSPSFKPAYIRIKPENTNEDSKFYSPFSSNQQYFEVVVNEMYLSYKRKWLTTYDPMVFVTTEFEYAGEKVTMPFVVGPALISDKKQKLPEGQGFLFKNTTVAGLHPAKGNAIAITLVLNRLPGDNALRKVLNVVEKVSGTFSKEFQAIAGGYLKIAGVVLQGMDILTESDEVKAIVGIRDEYGNDDLRPGYFALVNGEDQDFDENKFFVKGKELHYGNNMATCQPFRSDDYVLYSLRSETERRDVETLPMFQAWKDINSSLSKIYRKLTDDEKKLYRGQLFGLGTEMMFSPDLTEPQANKLLDEYTAKLEKEIARRDALSGEEHAAGKSPDEWKSKIERLSKKLYQ
ncbi:MAG: hypothetical protein K1X63_10595 [Chitinophagales bacterium]|nr:hypothetical protein [Bacteroidota bacterium]MBX7141515.1 hypothetical protein [Chitinophagales bacterium]